MTDATTAATPRPWKWIEPHSVMHQPDDLQEVYIPVAAIDGLFSKRHANGALIVRAVNAHDDLVAALRELVSLIPKKFTTAPAFDNARALLRDLDASGGAP